MKKAKFLSLLALLVMICVVATFALAACKDKETSEIKLSQTEMNLEEGDVGQLTVTVSGTDEAVSWTVAPADVVTLTRFTDKLYSVKAVKIGTAVITVKAGELSATCNVTVSEKEKVTITMGGQAVTEASVDMGESITLAASSNKGNPITAWVSSNENIATVNNGVVSALRPGKVTISAQVTASVKADLELTVNSVDGYEYYEIDVKRVGDKMDNFVGIWECWSEWGQFTQLNYDNGTVNIEFTENAGAWSNIQLMKIYEELDEGKYYKLSVDIDISVAGHITINGNAVDLQTGKHTYVVYFTGFDKYSMQFGVEGTAINIKEAKAAISNISFEEDTDRQTLVAPSFTYNETSGVITINDSNTAGVKNYILNLYKNGELVSAVSIKNSGEKIDWSKVVTGDYDAKIYAVASNSHYISSVESSAQTIHVVNEEGVRYYFHNAPPEGSEDNTEMDGGGVNAQRMPGIWTYWCSWWVTIDGNFKDNKLTVEFSNNSGLWYDTQLFYRHPGLENGKLYKIQLAIASDAEGMITFNGAEFKIVKSKESNDKLVPDLYDIYVEGSSGLTFTFVLGLNGQDNAQDIMAATMSFEIMSVNEVTKTKLQAPSFSLEADNVIKITDTNTVGVGRYELGFFKSGEQTPAVVVAVLNNEAVDLSRVPAGTYTVKLRAVAANIGYETSDWSSVADQITSTTSIIQIANGDEAVALQTPDTWIEWHDQANWTGATVKMEECMLDSSDNSLALKYSATGLSWFGVQLFKHYSTSQTNQAYRLTLKIQSSVSGSITVCGNVVTLKSGSNDVSVPFVQEGGKATIRIQFGVEKPASMIAGGEFTLSDIKVEKATQTKLSAPTFTVGSGNVITITDSQQGVGSYELGFFKSGEQNATAVVTVENGKAVDLSTVPAGTYTVKLRAVALNAGYLTSDWSTSTATIVSENEKTDIAYHEEGDSFTGWAYWDSKISADWNKWTKANCSECYMDNNGKVTMTYTVEGNGATWAMQMFYKSNVSAAQYNSSLKITASVNTTITVCGQSVELKAGEAKTVTVSNYKTEKGSAIDIQFGLKGGTFTIEDVTVA